MLEKLNALKEAFEEGNNEAVATLIDECIELASDDDGTATLSSGGTGNGPPPGP